MVISGIIIMFVAGCILIYNLVVTPALWGVKWPLLWVMLLSFAVGIGFNLVAFACISGLMNTVSRVKKKLKEHIEKHKTFEVLKRVREKAI
jgi:hypothetical protein